MSDVAAPKNELPVELIDRVIAPFSRFLHVEASGGIALLAATAVALACANSPISDAYLGFWRTKVTLGFGDLQMSYSLKHWINDGLMGIFFFVVGLEVKRELVLGELRDLKRAALPIAAAMGGMLVPAGIYLFLQHEGAASNGWGIPMATDIAFVVGCMAVLGNRVPVSLRVLLLSLAIADDIGAIIVIAIAYTETLSFTALALAFLGLAASVGCHHLGIRRTSVYVGIGGLVWLAFHESGIHATIAGVLLGLITPTGTYVGESSFARILASAHEIFEGDQWSLQKHRSRRVDELRRIAQETVSPVELLEHRLHPWTSFVIVPIFALANAGVPISFGTIGEPVAIAVALGLFVGKPVGILSFSFLAVRAGLARMPADLSWTVLAAAGILAGIGFTMSLFIAGLALRGSELLMTAKVGVLCGSVLSAVVGMLLLNAILPKEGRFRRP